MAVAAIDIYNGERFVVFIFVSSILYSTPFSLLYEAVGICLLAVAGFVLEVAVERYSVSFDRFSIRKGASSGIFLSTITMPAVMLSRLIQISRAIIGHVDRTEEFISMKMQFWTISTSCLGVLISIYCILQNSSKNYVSFSLSKIQNLKFNIICLVFYIGIACVSLMTESSTGFLVIIKIFWFLLHGLASVGVIWHLICTFPFCLSIGEALLVSSGLVLYYGDMTAYTLTKIRLFFLSSSKSDHLHYEEKSEISSIIQGMLFGLLLLFLFYKFFLKIEAQFISLKPDSQVVEENRANIVWRSVIFYSTLFVMLIMIAPSWMQYIRNFEIHPILWVFNFVFSEPSKRLLLCFYWLSIICVSVLRFYKISKQSKIERILLRKYYHLVAVAMFLPAVIFQSDFLDLAFGAALAVFLILEMIRVWKIWPCWKIIDQFMNAFTDHRDSDILIISHFSLLLGCALPKWMSSGFNDRPLAPFAGILSLGIGDTMASVVGHKYGVLRCSKAGNKTIEGTAAGITSVLITCSILLSLMASTGYILSQPWLSLLLAVTISGLLEAYTTQLDNAFIPLVFYSLLCL